MSSKNSRVLHGYRVCAEKNRPKAPYQVVSYFIVSVVASSILLALLGCSPETQVEVQQITEGLATAAASLVEISETIVRSDGGSILYLQSEDGDSDVKVFVIDFADESYPVVLPDGAFLTQQQIGPIPNGGATWELACGFGGNENYEIDTAQTTTVVFWSGADFSGSSQAVRCGGTLTPDDYLKSGRLDATPRSICLVTENTPEPRQSRCLNGTRCDDGWRSGNETDVDCGGDQCEGCEIDQVCEINTDCKNNSCIDQRCKAPSCIDGVKNGTETDVDCGGSDCPGCANGFDCRRDSDCMKNSECENGTCSPKTTCSGALATQSASEFKIYVEKNDLDGCVSEHPRNYLANSRAEAFGCAESDGYTPVLKVCLYQGQSVDYQGNEFVIAESETRAVTCLKNSYCSDCRWTVSLVGSCGESGSE